MTNEEKKKIDQLLLDGNGYKRIATLLGLSENSVKSYCSRHKPVTAKCLNCGSVLTRTPHKRVKKFCSDKCRLTWWNKHPEKLHHRSERTVECPVCGKSFTVYGAVPRKYCSQGCYHASSVRKEVSHD